MLQFFLFLLCIVLVSCQNTVKEGQDLERYLKNVLHFSELPQEETQIILVNLDCENCVISYLSLLIKYQTSQKVILIFSGKYFQQNTSKLIEEINKIKTFTCLFDIKGMASRYDIDLSKIVAYKVKKSKVIEKLRPKDTDAMNFVKLLTKF